MSAIKALSQITFFIALVVCLFSCKKEKPFQVVVGKPVMIESRDLKPPIKQDLKFKFSNLDLYQNLGDLNLEQFKKYGTFYTKDFTIFHVNNLDLLEDNIYIVEIYLYFIDGALHKIQAHTTKNMSDFFLSKYGGAKLILRDRYNKDLVKNEGAIYKKRNNYHINENLNNYKLKWRLDDRVLSYYVDESSQKNFEVIEELVDIDNQKDIKFQPKYVFTIESASYQQLLSRVKMEELLVRN